MTPQLDDFLPQEDTLYVNAGEPIGFALICDDEGVTYSWYVDDELQQATGFSFDLTLTVNDWHEVIGVVSNDNYDLPKVWWVFITGGSGITNDVVSNRTVLYQNIPNPFNPETNIKFYLKDAGFVSLEVFNLKGQLVKTLVNNDLPVGEYSFIWNGKDQNGNQVASGIYLYSLRTKDISEKKKAILLK
ncbi:MAG: FlgD immunoglobulin-like domain containing protein [Candidatus Cloacimonadota bacterium]|nr:FlgD immunoglobulin-like domain containing protein [Candidatus Cloacimonadota bacterium]